MTTRAEVIIHPPSVAEVIIHPPSVAEVVRLDEDTVIDSAGYGAPIDGGEPASTYPTD